MSWLCFAWLGPAEVLADGPARTDPSSSLPPHDPRGWPAKPHHPALRVDTPGDACMWLRHEMGRHPVSSLPPVHWMATGGNITDRVPVQFGAHVAGALYLVLAVIPA